MRRVTAIAEERRDLGCSLRTGPGGAILRFGAGGAGPLPIVDSILSMPIPVVSVSIDTTGMRDPVIMLTFTGQINLLPCMFVNLNFIIRKSTDGGPPQQIGGTYSFIRNGDKMESTSFTFQIFDGDSCPSCSTYAVELSTTSIIEDVVGLTISNASLSALAVDKG